MSLLQRSLHTPSCTVPAVNPFYAYLQHRQSDGVVPVNMFWSVLCVTVCREPVARFFDLFVKGHGFFRQISVLENHLKGGALWLVGRSVRRFLVILFNKRRGV